MMFRLYLEPIRKATGFMDRLYLLIFLLVGSFNYVFAQPQIKIETETAMQYVKYAQQEINEGRWKEALAVMERANDFADSSSDISWLLAITRLHDGRDRINIVNVLDRAINTNIWVNYNKNQALLLKAELLIAMRKYKIALDTLDQIKSSGSVNSNAGGPAVDFARESLMLRLGALRGLASSVEHAYTDAVMAAGQFRSLTITAMDRYPRDPRPLKIFYEYARNSKKPLSDPLQADINLLELAKKRLPFLLEADPELAWLACPFISDTEEAKRLILSYRSGGLKNIQVRDFRPRPESIPEAMNLGLLSDIEAANELFTAARGANFPVWGFEGEHVIDLEVIADTYNLLGSEEGREFFTKKLLSFSGIIIFDNDNDGIIDSRAHYQNGKACEYFFDMNQTDTFDFKIIFSGNGTPESAQIPVTGFDTPADVVWERYPSAQYISLNKNTYIFHPAGFQYAPINFYTAAGSLNYRSIVYPLPAYQYINVTRKSLVSFAVSVRRPSVEFENGIEEIFLENGIPVKAIETFNDNQVSITEFEKGTPVVQHIDLDLDGRMETIRKFRPPQINFFETLDYRSLISSSQSDWEGNGIYKTGEMYLQDGSVVYSWDIDGSGSLNYKEQINGNER